ncbi:MAG: hypothetical protein ACRC6M_11910, partial [Microcystaceae cyanobacterium]
MKYFKIAILVGILCLTGHFFWQSPVFSQSPPASVQWVTEPTLETVRPLAHEPVQITLKAVAKTGKPLENAQIHLILFTPAPTPWFSTDFPWVEGTTLLDLTQTTRTGEVTFEQIFPIRGDYRLQVKVTPLIANTFQPFEQTLVWAIAEKEIRYRNYALLLVLLLFIGAVGGWVIGTKDSVQAGEVAPQKVRLLLSSATIIAIAVLLFINITAEAGSSHTEHNLIKQNSSLANTQKNAQLSLELIGSNEAMVGQLVPLTVAVKNTQNSQGIADQVINIQTKQLEHEQITFAIQGRTDAAGKFQWQQQFFDGSPHQLTVNLLSSPANSQTSLQVEKAIAVEGLEPPLIRRIISLGYMILVLILGFSGGFGLNRLRQSSR